MSITDELRGFANSGMSAMECSAYSDKLIAIADRIDAAVEGMVELTKDADNVPIHIGDVMEWVRYKDDDPTVVRTVSGIGNGVFFAWSDEQGRYAQYEAHAYRHYHAPTVEDVLREFAYGLGVPVADSYVAAAAAKLRLAEEEDA